MAELSVRYRAAGNGAWRETDWIKVDSSTDYSQLFELKQLEPIRSTKCPVVRARSVVRPSLRPRQVRFTRCPPSAPRATCALLLAHAKSSRIAMARYGMDLYRTLMHRKVDLFVLAGDVVYYDKLARSVPLAHYHWQRTYSLPTLVNFHRSVHLLFEEDDTIPSSTIHGRDSITSGPANLPLKMVNAFSVSKRGVPELAYRTRRMGRDLQLWFMEGRDYRDPNSQVDGPDKSIWGLSNGTGYRSRWLTPMPNSRSSYHRRPSSVRIATTKVITTRTKPLRPKANACGPRWPKSRIWWWFVAIDTGSITAAIPKLACTSFR